MAETPNQHVLDELAERLHARPGHVRFTDSGESHLVRCDDPECCSQDATDG